MVLIILFMIRWMLLDGKVCAMSAPGSFAPSRQSDAPIDAGFGPSQKFWVDLDSRNAVLQAEERRRAGDAAYSVEEIRGMLKERYASERLGRVLVDADKAYERGEYVDGASFTAAVRERYGL